VNRSSSKILFSFLLPLLFFISLNAQVKHPEWSYNLSIYEVNVRQFSEEGTFSGFEKQLPRLKEMGVGIIWFMPITPIGDLNRKGTLGSYYSVKDYMAVNPEFGTIEEFKDLVKKIHEMDMYVIIDWVANHTAWDNNLVNEHPEWFTKNNDGEFVPPVADWSDVIDLNYENEELHTYMVNAMKFWVTETDIDGYRCDVAGMVPMKFWTRVRKELDSIKPVFILAEAEGPEFHENAFDATYSWNLFNLMNDAAERKKNAEDFVYLFEKERDEYNDSDFRMRFTSNHDENTWKGTVFERLGDAAGMFAALTFIVDGIPLIYNGQESGLNKRLEFFERDPIEWKEHKFNDLYTKLLNLKRDNAALFNGERGGKQQFIDGNNEDILVIYREKNDDKVLALFNISESEVKSFINDRSISGEYYDLFSGEKINVSSEREFILKPWDFKIFVNE
jgi:cyclomaltodextrinase / maltogenic alpha-amylase / neopullulanase